MDTWFNTSQKKHIWLWLLLTLLCACSAPQTQGPPVVSLETLFKVDLPQDGPIRTTVLDMVADDQGVYLSKSKPAEILGFDRQLAPLLRLDGFGKGTEHFEWVGNMAVRDDLFFIWESPDAIEVYDRQASFVQQVLLPAFGASRFAVDAQMWLYISTPSGVNPIEVLDLNGESQRGFGQWIDNPQYPQRRRFDNKRHLFLDDSGNLVCLSITEAQVEVYNADGQLLVRRELADNPYFVGYFREREDFYEKHPKKRLTAVFHLVVDAAFANNQLYLLYANNGPGRPANHVMVVAVSDKQIEPGSVFQLRQEGESVGFNAARMAVWKDRLYAFNLSDNGLHRFPKP